MLLPPINNTAPTGLRTTCAYREVKTSLVNAVTPIIVMDQQQEDQDANPKYSHPELVNKLISPAPGLKCAHLNINGLFAKLEDVEIILSETKLDIFAITETHLEEKHDDDDLKIDNYLFLRNDRKKKTWGGVFVYYRKDLDIDEIDIKTEIESIWFDIIVNSQKYFFGCIYRPPKFKKSLQDISKVLEGINHRSNIFLLGDFNIDLSEDNDKLTRDFKFILAANSLTNVIMKFTRITAMSKTLIDLAITANPDKITKSGTYAPGISDHDLIYIVIGLRWKRKPPKIIFFKNYRNVDIIKLKEDLDTCPCGI
eukprot:TCONS_00038248-protein